MGKGLSLLFARGLLAWGLALVWVFQVPATAGEACGAAEIASNLKENLALPQAPKLNSQLTMEQLADADGSIYLIREIRGKYTPGFRGFYTKVTGWTSYSIDPLRYLGGGSTGAIMPGAENLPGTILISKQNLSQDLEFNSPVKVDFVKLSKTTAIGDISPTYHEVRVKPQDENVVRVMTQKEYLDIMAGISDVQNVSDYRAMISSILDHSSPP